MSSDAFCGCWTVLYAMLLEMSVFMVAMISLSRLILLMNPTVSLTVKYSWIIPLGYCLVTISIKVIYTALNITTYSFVPPLMACVFLALDGTATGEGEPMVNLPNELVLAVTETVQTGFTALPISLCSALSLWLLWRSKKNSKQVGGTVKKQEEATKTVIIFTVMYVVCNIPIFIYNIFFWVWNLSIDRTNVYMTYSRFMESYLEVYSTVFLTSYSSIVVSRVFPAINSTLNPVLYYWRMEKFRVFLHTVWTVSNFGNSQSENVEL